MKKIEDEVRKEPEIDYISILSVIQNVVLLNKQFKIVIYDIQIYYHIWWSWRFCQRNTNWSGSNFLWLPWSNTEISRVHKRPDDFFLYLRWRLGKGKEVTLEEMDDNPEIDSWIMKDYYQWTGRRRKSRNCTICIRLHNRTLFLHRTIRNYHRKKIWMVPNVPRNRRCSKQTVDFEEMAAAREVLLIWMKTSMETRTSTWKIFDQEGFDIGGDTSSPYEEEKNLSILNIKY